MLSESETADINMLTNERDGTIRDENIEAILENTRMKDTELVEKIRDARKRDRNIHRLKERQGQREELYPIVNDNNIDDLWTIGKPFTRLSKRRVYVCSSLINSVPAATRELVW